MTHHIDHFDPHDPRRRGVFLPCLLTLGALLPLLLFRDFTPANELRYLSIADEALRNGSLFTFTLSGIPYADKPPLYLWVVMLARTLFGNDCMWFLSLFSLIPAFVSVAAMHSLLPRRLSCAIGEAAAYILLTSGLFLVHTFFLRMDMLMTMWILLALRGALLTARGLWTPVKGQCLIGLFTFLALFTKGPVGVLMPIATTLCYFAAKRQWHAIRLCWGWRTWAILLGGSLVWFGAVYLEGGSAYLDNLLFHQTIDRAVDAFHHKRPFWYYAVALTYSLAPWTLLVAYLAGRATVRYRTLGALQQFLLFAAGITLLMLSCFSSKLAVYMLPALPLLIYAAAIEGDSLSPRGHTIAKVCILIPAAVLLPAGIGAIVAAAKKRSWQVIARNFAWGVLLCVFIAGCFIRPINALIGYGEICREARSLAEREGLSAYYTRGIERTDGMEIYLGSKPTDLEKETPLRRGVVIYHTDESCGLLDNHLRVGIVDAQEVDARSQSH